jgi:cell division protein FtsQ
MPLPAKERSKPANILRVVGWYATWSILSIVVVSILAGFILSLPVWRIRSVQVLGNNFLPEAKIINTAKIPRGENIFLVDLDEVKDRFSDVIQIKGIKVKRKLPDKIIIDVKERIPFAIVVIGGTTSLVDEDGYMIARQSLASSMYKVDITKYPVIRGIFKKNLENGVRLNPGDRAFVKAALEMLSKFIDLGTIQIEAGNREDIIIYIEDILKVKIGDARDIERKIKIVNALLGSVKGKWTKIAYMDVRVPDCPVIKYK